MDSSLVWVGLLLGDEMRSGGVGVVAEDFCPDVFCGFERGLVGSLVALVAAALAVPVVEIRGIGGGKVGDAFHVAAALVAFVGREFVHIGSHPAWGELQ